MTPRSDQGVAASILPSTEAEDRLMGGTSDAVRGVAKDARIVRAQARWTAPRTWLARLWIEPKRQRRGRSFREWSWGRNPRQAGGRDLEPCKGSCVIRRLEPGPRKGLLDRFD
jgi:hypothetical protein